MAQRRCSFCGQDQQASPAVAAGRGYMCSACLADAQTAAGIRIVRHGTKDMVECLFCGAAASQLGTTPGSGSLASVLVSRVFGRGEHPFELRINGAAAICENCIGLCARML